jgi:hypothetical protein
VTRCPFFRDFCSPFKRSNARTTTAFVGHHVSQTGVRIVPKVRYFSQIWRLFFSRLWSRVQVLQEQRRDDADVPQPLAQEPGRRETRLPRSQGSRVRTVRGLGRGGTH